MPVYAHHEGQGEATWPLDAATNVAEAMLRALGIASAELSLVLCDDDYIRELNRSYRDRDQATDVLAFAMQEGEAVPEASGLLLLGDIVISLPTAARQAQASGRGLAQVATELLAHGLLHLLGFDHASEDEERRMWARTHALVSAARNPAPSSSVTNV